MGKGNKRLTKLYGKDEEGNATLPTKMGSVFASRIDNGVESGCTFCFPHGFETINPRSKKGRKPKNKNPWRKARNGKKEND